MPEDALPVLPPLPGWITAASDETVEAAAFRSGAALAHLSFATARGDVPGTLWRDRLALQAAEVSLRISGRRDGTSTMRDALHLARPGDDPGPAGRVLRQWSRAVARPISVAGLARALERVTPERIALCLDATAPTPMDRAAQVIEAVLADNPRDETAALILAEAVLAQSLGETHVLPLLSLGLTARDLRLRGDDLRLHTGLMAPIAAKGRELLPESLFATPRLPLIDGRGQTWWPGAQTPGQIRDYTLGHQVTEAYDFTAAIRSAARDFAPDLFVLTGPGATLGGAALQALILSNWRGLSCKADAQAQNPLLSMALPDQRILTGAPS